MCKQYQDSNKPPQQKHPPPWSAQMGKRLGTPQVPPPAGTRGPVQLGVPDPFTRKISRFPKKHFTQSSSRFNPQKPPPDYKPLPLLKGKSLSICERLYCLCHYTKVKPLSLCLSVLLFIGSLCVSLVEWPHSILFTVCIPSSDLCDC